MSRPATATTFAADRLLDVAVPAALLIIWFIVGHWKLVDPFLVPPPA
ncbi:MAG: hypothetical protein JWO28_281, partial [Hyphomicrobiales bacterium]|nr:hypothetical protein [Hyphomicrobiales bacterium]